MSLSDEIAIRVAGNLCRPVKVVSHGGERVAATVIAAAPIALIGGRLDGAPTYLPLEVRGAANVAAFAARAGVGSRLILRGCLEQRRSTHVEELPRADGEGTVAARVTRSEYVIVVERLLQVTPPDSTAVEDRQES
jgi:hypothetical protein